MGAFDDLIPGASSQQSPGVFDDLVPKQNKGLLGDTLTDLKRGVEQIPGAITGLSDIINPLTYITKTRMADQAANWLGDKTGFQPSKWQEQAAEEYSPQRKASDEAISKAWEGGDAANIAGTYLTNPRSVLGVAVQSAPSIVAGGGLSRLAMKAGAAITGTELAALTKAAQAEGAAGAAARETLNRFATTASAVGEGAITAGQNMDQTSRDVDPGKAALTSLAAGTLTAGIGKMSGRVANKLGLPDVETAMAGGGLQKSGLPWYKRIPSTMVQEGLLEEFPQSAQEQIWQNLAEGKPWYDDTLRQGVEGALAGAAMGGGAGVVGGHAAHANDQDAAPGTPDNQQPSIAGYLPAPVSTGTPSEQVLLSQVERQKAVDQAQANADKIYAERALYEETMKSVFPYGVPTITQPIATVQDRINELLGIDRDGLKGLQRVQYQKALEKAYSEQVGITHDANGAEIPLTMGDLLNSQATVEITLREKRQQAIDNAAAQALARNEQLASEEETQQPDIPVVGPLSAVAKQAVDTGVASYIQTRKALEDAPKPLDGGESNGNVTRPIEHAAVAAPSASSQGGNVSGGGNDFVPVPAGNTGTTNNRAEVAAASVRTPVSTANDSAPSVKAYPMGQARMVAARLTKQGLPTEAYPHPTQPGMFALRIPGEANAESGTQPAVQNQLPAAEQVAAVSPAPAAIQSSPEAPAREVKKASISKIMRRDDLVGAIMRVTGGRGIASSMAQTLTGDTANRVPKLRGLFTNQGQIDMDDLAMLLREQEAYAVRDGSQLEEMIREAAGGNVPVSMERQERDAEANKEKQYRDMIRAKARKFGIKTVAVKFSALESLVLAKMEERHNQAVEMLDEHSRQRFEEALNQAMEAIPDPVVDETLADVVQRGMHARQFWNEATRILRGMIYDAETEASNATATAQEVSDGRGNQATGGGTPIDQRDQAQPAEGFQLVGQTAEEVKRQEAQRKAEEEAAKRPEPDNSPKVKADQVDLFNTQGGLFDGKQAASAVPEPANRKTQAQAESKSLEPFEIDLGSMFGKMKYRPQNIPDIPDGHTIVDSSVVVRKTSIRKHDSESYNLPRTVFAWRISSVLNRDGDPYSMIEAMTSDFGRTENGEVRAYFTKLDSNAADALGRIAPSVESKAVHMFQMVSRGQRSMFSEPKESADLPSVETASAPVASTDQAQPSIVAPTTNVQRTLPDRIAAAKQKKADENAARAAKFAELRAKRKAQAATEKQDGDKFANNTVFTADKVAAARARLKSKLGTLNSGIDPELLMDGMTLAGAYIEAGVRAFPDYAKAMVEDFGDKIKPYLLSFYEAARAYPGIEKDGMTPASEAATQHKALLTPDVKEAAKEVLGEMPKVARAPKAKNLGEAMKLKQDWGVDNIDGWTESPTGKNQGSDFGLRGGIKDDFLNDARRYLNQVAKLLQAQGFTPHLDKKGKPTPAVSVNESGTATSGEAMLTMARDDFGVYVQIGVSSVRGLGGKAHPQGVAIIARTTNASTKDRYATNGTNNWLATDLNAGDLAAWLDGQDFKRAKKTAAPVTESAEAVAERQHDEYPAKAKAMFAEMNDDEKAGVQFGMFPAAVMKQAKDDGFADTQALTTALMAEDAQARKKPAMIETPEQSATLGEKGKKNANAAPATTEKNGDRVPGSGTAGDVSPAETERGTGGSRRDAGAGRDGAVREPDGGDVAGGQQGNGANGERVADGEQPVHDAPGKSDSGKRSRANAGLSRGRDGARNHVAPVGALTRKGSWQETARRNVEIIKLVKRLGEEGRLATADEQALIAQYVGFGASELANGLFPLEYEYVRGRRVATGRVDENALKSGWKEIYFDLKNSVTEDDMKQIMASTQFAHYTPESVIRSIWKAVERFGFQGGKIVEPGMGTGLFMVAAPEGIAASSRYVGIERDSVTAAIAGQLLQAQNVIRNSYIDQNLPDNNFDMAIGNPPFANWKVTADPRYKRNGFLLHDYFFAKTIDKVRPGGVLVFVTSKGTMDKADDKARAYLAERADLLGAIRLPQTAFKGNAGTEVVTDVLFLQKREDGAAPSSTAWAGLKEVETPQGPTPINEYFADHPEMVLGRHEMTGSMYRSNMYTVTPLEGDIEEHFAKAVERLPENVYTKAAPVKKGSIKGIQQKSDRQEFDVHGKKEGGLYIAADGELMQVVDGVGVPISNIIALTDKERAWLNDYVPLRDSLKQAMNDQLDDGDWETSLAALKKAYAAFKKKHGRILEHTTYEREFENEAGDKETRTYKRFKWNKLFSSKVDVEASLVFNLEDTNDHNSDIKDGGILTNGRVLAKRAEAEIKTVNDAFAVTLNTLGHLDIPRVAELMGLSEEDAIRQLGDLIFEHPVEGWQTADEYLSGNVLKKLEEAEVAASTDPRFQRNVQALIAVQPAPLGPDRIAVRLGANWISADVVSTFVAEALGQGAAVTYEPRTNRWTVEGENLRCNRAAGAEWGTADRSMSEILSSVLNNESITIRRTTEDKKTYVDKDATAKANDLAEKMRQRFASWIWTDAARTDTLLTVYNRKFNNLAPRAFDGKHLTLPGLSMRYKLYDHQLRAIWRVVQTGNTYLDHAVGAGKTLEMIVSAMEQKRLGLINKPMFVVPNHMLEQFANEFQEAYPAARILVADKENFIGDQRRRFVAKAAMNDWDAIVIKQSSFGLIGIKQETADSVADDMLDELQSALDDAGSDDRTTRKKLEAQIDQLKQRVDSMVGKGDGNITFEELGVDFLYVDEAHTYRKLDYATNRQIKGIDPTGSKGAFGMFVKTRYLNMKRPGRSVVMASGTPVTNTIAELYTVQRFLDYDGLREDGLRAFDAWANNFGAVGQEWERNAAGEYEKVERFSKFVNVPELMQRVRRFMDVLTMEQLGEFVKRPDLKGGQPEMVTAKKSDALERYMHTELLPRLEQSKQWKPTKEEPYNPDPVIAIGTDGRLAAIDVRFAYPTMKDDPGSKLNLMIDGIIAEYQATADNVYTTDGKEDARRGGTQIVFSSVGFGENVEKNRGFSPRKWMLERLKKAGIPTSEVAFMSDYKTDKQKESMFKEMREGKKRILVGSPANMGTGVNVQKRLTTLHFMAPPWYPSDVEQPHGRILRQGNQNKEVSIKWYMTAGTYDSTMWGMVRRKGTAIEQAFRGDGARTIEDISEVSSYAMAEAVAAGDDRVIKLAEAQANVEKYTRLKNAHFTEQRQLRGDVASMDAEARSLRAKILEFEKAVEAQKAADYAYWKDLPVTVDGQTVTKPGEIGEKLSEKVAEVFTKGRDIVLAKVHGVFELIGAYTPASKNYSEKEEVGIALKVDPVSVHVTDGTLTLEEWTQQDPVGLGQRVRNAMRRIAERLNDHQSRLASVEKDLGKKRPRLGAPFADEALLTQAIADAATLQAELVGESVKKQNERAAAKKGTESTPEAATDEGVALQEESAVYTVNEPDGISGDLFQGAENALPAAARKNSLRPKPGGNIDRAAPRAVLAVREAPDTEGLYNVQAQLVTVGERQLPVASVNSPEDAARAFAHLTRFAVEHMDGLVTDKSGKPLAIIGALKGAPSQASVYPSTILMELSRIEGAANLWLSHNHPSGVADLSSADRNIAALFERTLEGTSVSFRGVSAMARTGDTVNWSDSDYNSGSVDAKEDAPYRVAIVEREIIESNPGAAISSPADAERLVSEIAKDKPGIVFVTSQNQIASFVPFDPEEMGKLRYGDRLMRLFRAAARSGGSGAFVAMPDGRVLGSEFANLKGALEQIDVRVLDGIEYSSDGTGTAKSLAEQGLDNSAGTSFFNRANDGRIQPADKVVYGMAAEGKSATEILKFIASASRNPFNRQLAKLLQQTGINPTITVDTAKNWREQSGSIKDVAAYSQRRNAIALFRPAGAEQNTLHESVHAATLKALAKNGLAAAQMRALFSHVKSTGRAKGLFYDKKTGRGYYGMSDVGEFVAEAFSNPKFQQALKKVKAPQGGTLQSAWHWFVRVVRGILGLKQGDESALSAVLELGVGVMRENMGLSDAGGDVRYASETGKIDQTETPEFKRWFGDSKVVDTDGKPLVVYHGTRHSFDEFKREGRGGRSRLHYFSSDPSVASEYAGRVEYGDPNVVPAFVALQNPFMFDAGGALWGSLPLSLFPQKIAKHFNERNILRGRSDQVPRVGFTEVIRSAVAAGYDGVIADNIVDGGGPYGDQNPSKVAVATRPEQIKSAIGNNGDFDPSNPDIRYNVADDGAWAVSAPSKMDDVIYSLQDKHIDTKRVIESIRATGKKIIDEFNPYLQEELFHGRAAKGVKDFLDMELRPLLAQMQAAKIDMGDFEEYLWNRHAEERNAQIAKINPEMKDGGSGINTADAKAYLAGLSSEKKATFEALAKRVDAINRNSQEILVRSGLEKQETIDAWNGAYQHYVPLQREDVDSGHIGTGKGFSVRGSSTKRAMGSGKNVVDILANITMQRERNIVRAEKNRVSNALMGLALENKNAEFWKVDEAPKERVVNEKAIYTVLDADGKKVEEFTRMSDAEKALKDVPDGTIDQKWGDRVEERVTPGFTSRDNVILTRVNGEDHYIIFNERNERAMRMAATLKNLDADNMGRVLSLVGKATRYLSSINTQYNPVFGVINLIRDAQGALLNLSSTPLAGEQKKVLGYTKDALVNIYKDIRAHRKGQKPSSEWAELFEEFQKEGGATGYRDQYANAEQRAEAIRSELKQFAEGKPKKLARGLFGWLSDYNETMENAVRLAAYRAAKEKGMSKQQSASAAKNLTVNFNRKGQMATQIGALYAFFNASVQGTARIAETLFEHEAGDWKSIRLSKTGKKILAGGIMLGSMQAMLLAAAGYDDDEPPDFVRERNLILPIGNGKYLTLAMPLGFHVLPSIGRIVTEYVLSGGKDPMKRVAALASLFSDTFNPIGNAGFSLQSITPSVVDPFAALAENKDFTGKQIYREDFNSLNPQTGNARAKDVATFYSKWISAGLNWITGGSEFRPGMVSWSPDALDYLVGQATGGVGREVNKVFQTGRAVYTGEDLPLYKVPLVGRFVGDTQGQSSQSQKFYEGIRQLNMLETEYKGLLKAGRVQEARSFMAENPGVKLILMGNATQNQVRKLREQKSKLVDDGADSARVKEIDSRITEAMRRFNERAATVI